MAVSKRPQITLFRIFSRCCSASGVAAISLLVAAGRGEAQVPSFDAPVAIDSAARTDAHSDEFPRIAAGVGGVWVIVWQVVGANDLGLGRDIDVVYSRSSDDGAHWTPPKPVTDTFQTDRAEDRQPAVTTDGKGTWIIVWTSTEDLEALARRTAPRRDRDIHYVVSTDNALTWSERRSLNSNGGFDWGDDESPDIATDDKGRWTAVWESSDSLGNTKGGDRDILYSTSVDAGKTWSPPDVIDPAARSDLGYDTSPRVAVDTAGTWMVAWSSGGVSDDKGGFQRGVFVSRSIDATASWDPPQALAGTSEDDRPDFGPRLAGDGRGNWVCAWSSADPLGDTIGRDRDLLFVRSTDGGRTWSTRAPLNREAASDSGDDDTPELAVDGYGNWVVAWTSWDRRGAARGADADLLVAMSRDQGANWTQSFILNTNAKHDLGEDTTPSLATDGSGTWITAWSSTESFGEVLDRDRDILVAIGHFGREITGPPSRPNTP